ncbi:glycoside hydrolase family 92 protein [Motilibacter sp. E257]|uniref:Glycoside hydrolase family 92 protein n=1 Tax=Motilibacter deserti TaxID=2714956 RepID=A0ABX0H2X8_9ACTN|nr:GH92 family glycosyl hydrolase [Motilibacter deserti]NHC16154.1 glycoside hydrolase family 92 protein [Motilibacter deserti]
MRRTSLAATAVAALSLALPAATASAAPAAVGAAAAADAPLTSLVNPFIGSQNEGNTYPGATVPFGMAQLSPDTGHSTGYNYSHDRIRGFSMVHISGVGCGLGGDLPVLPTTGAIGSTDYAQYQLPFSHTGETASPGYYKVPLTASQGTITAELGATTHTGWSRYTFPATTEANVLVNTGQALHGISSSEVRVIDDRTVESRVTGSGFCQSTKPYTLYFVTKFDRPFASYGTWDGATVTAGSNTSSGSGRRGAYLRFDTTGDRDVVATTSISYVDLDGARKNLAAEGGGTFDSVVAAAQAQWEQRLAQVRVQGGSETQRRTFYSSLYRSLLAPNTGTDVDGRYTGWDQKVHSASGFTYYQNWSLWDTYRTQQQLLSLLAPQESRDMALSLLRVDAEGGWLPRWGYATVETNIMTGDPVTSFLTTAYQQGLLKGHEEEAYAALKKNADGVPPAESQYNGRAGNEFYLANGYVPYIPTATGKPGDYDLQHGPSATLEYALADSTLAAMAKDLGHPEDAARFQARGQNFRNVFDPRTGFFRARDENGMFVGPADPANSVGFHEGTSWQYMWLAQQDLPQLIDLIGGKDATNARLDSFFAYDRLLADSEDTVRNVWVNGPYAYYNQDKYNPQNEPDLHSPYIYLWTGQPWKTTDVVHAATTLFTDGPTGMTGNDDLGTMSAWHVLSSIGVYPVIPGSEVWGLTSPVFERVDLTLDPEWYPRGSLTISAPGTSATNRYIQRVDLGGKKLRDTWITGEDIRAGKDITFTVGSTPSTWGTRDSSAPPAIGAGYVPQSRLALGVTSSSAGIIGSAQDQTVDLTAAAVSTTPGRAYVTVTASAPAPLRVTPTNASAYVQSDNLPMTQETALRVTVPGGTPAGKYPVTVTAKDTKGNSVTRTAVIDVLGQCGEAGGFCPQDLSAAYDVDGAATSDNRAQGNFDGGGWSFPAEQLPAAGVGIVGGRVYAFPSATGTARNFIAANGQTVPLAPGRYAALEVLLSAHNGDFTGNATVNYADGTSSTVQLKASDWAAGSPRLGEDRAITVSGRYHTGGGGDGLTVSIWHNTLTLDPAKQAVSVTLPSQSRIKVYAITARMP